MIDPTFYYFDKHQSRSLDQQHNLVLFFFCFGKEILLIYKACEFIQRYGKILLSLFKCQLTKYEMFNTGKATQIKTDEIFFYHTLVFQNFFQQLLKIYTTENSRITNSWKQLTS